MRFGEETVAAVVSESGRLTVRTPAHGLGGVSVTLTNPNGGTVTVAQGFTYAVAEDEPGTTLAGVVVYSSLLRPGQDAGLRFEKMPAGSRARVFSLRGTCVADFYEAGPAEWCGTAGTSTAETQPSGPDAVILEHKGAQRRVHIAIQR